MLAQSIESEDGMRRAAQAATIGLAALLVFQAALAAGAPLGDAAWGGAHAHLTTAQRAASATSVLFYVAAILVIRGRAAGREERRYRWGIWALTAILAIAGVMNFASDSRWENLLLAPVALVLAALCAVVARGAANAPSRAAAGRPTLVTPAR
jgi:MFS-type transporter involved in bile tolerance (Atg22 family)